MKRNREEPSFTALLISAALVMMVLLLLEDYLTFSTDDTFWENLLIAPAMLFGGYLLGGVLFVLPAVLIQALIDKWEEDYKGKVIFAIIAAVIVCVIYALIKTYN